MRRILVLTLAVLLTSGYFPGPAAAVDTQGPACANIKTGSGTYQVRPGPGPSGDAAFHFEFTIAVEPTGPRILTPWHLDSKRAAA